MAKLITEEEFEIAVAYLRVLILTSVGKERQELKPRCLRIDGTPAEWERPAKLVWDPPLLVIEDTANFIWDPDALSTAVYDIEQLSDPTSGDRGCAAKGSAGPYGLSVYFHSAGALEEVLVALHGGYGHYKVESTRKGRAASDEMGCRRVVARVISERGIEVSAGRREALRAPKLPPHMLPGPNFVRPSGWVGGYTRISKPAKPIQEPEPEPEPPAPRIKAHVESTRYKEPAPKTETKLEWGDYTALIEAIERADPKRKRKKPTPPPKPTKVREPKPKRRIRWDWMITIIELLIIGVVGFTYATQGRDHPALVPLSLIGALGSIVGLYVLECEDSDE